MFYTVIPHPLMPALFLVSHQVRTSNFHTSLHFQCQWKSWTHHVRRWMASGIIKGPSSLLLSHHSSSSACCSSSPRARSRRLHGSLNRRPPPTSRLVLISCRLYHLHDLHLGASILYNRNTFCTFKFCTQPFQLILSLKQRLFGFLEFHKNTSVAWCWACF